ncbi:MAG: hypothetical protein ACI9DK_001729 [Vicingaceae bacterium]|jgi:hypothetical protein
MSFLTDLQYILNSDFIWTNSYFEEPTIMKVDVNNDGCQVLVFQLDRQLDGRYRGGLYPFFNNGNAKVCKACDYIMFSENEGSFYAIVIEMKKGDNSTSEQLKAGLCFVDFVISTVNRVHRKNYTVESRKVSIKEIKRKRKTKIRDISYNADSHHTFDQSIFRSRAFLK